MVFTYTTRLLATLPDLSPHQAYVQWLAESDFTFPVEMIVVRED